MSEIIYKVLEDCEVKKLGDRVYEFTASTSVQDRDGEVIEASGWDLKNFKKNPVIMYAHDYRTLPIGKAPRVWISSGNELKNTVEFPPEGTYEFADIVERLVDTGFLKTESVGFIPKKWEDGDGEKSPKRRYSKQELLEISIVPVPSNPDALRNAVDEGVITTKELEVLTKPEETENLIRIPVPGEEGKHDGHRIRTIDIDKDKGIKALYCGECKKVITYLFDKDKGWTMAKAKKWVEDHSKSIDDGLLATENEPESLDFEALMNPQPKEISQAEIRDELDYIKGIIQKEGMNEDVTGEAWELVREVMRLTGSDIPDDITAKVGAVLNQKNRDRLNQIKSLAQAVIDSAGESDNEPKDDKKEVVSRREEFKAIFKEVIEEAQGKVN